MNDDRVIKPRQRYDVLVATGDGDKATERFRDGGFSVSAGGVLSVSTTDGKQAKAWAPGYWATCEVVASDG